MILFNLGCGSIFLLAFMMLSHAKTANRWMGVFYLFAGFAMLGSVLEQFNIQHPWKLLIPAMEITRFAMAPALYFSIRYYIGEHYQFRRNDLVHFIPVLLFLPVLLGAHRYLPSWMGIVVGLSIKLQVILYWVAGYRMLHKQRLTWLKNLMLLTGIMILSFLLSPYLAKEISYIIYLITIYSSCYYALRKNISSSPAKPRLKENESSKLSIQLAQLMQEEKLYTEPDLSLSQLATRMDISLHEISWLLNKEIGKNFYQYVNHFRIEEAKELLQSPGHQHLNILAIGFTAGFNSKTAFNSAFKKMVGMTPADFRNLVVRVDAGGQ